MNTPIRALVVDDEPLAREGLCDILSAIPEVEVVGEARDGLEAVREIGALSPQVVFLDVEMPGLNGFEVVASLPPESRPAIVFVTAYDEYAVRAFEINAVDYVLKPFDEGRVRAAAERASERVASRARGAVDQGLALLLKSMEERTRYAARFVGTTAGRLQVVGAEEVEWIEAADNYVCLHASAGRAMLRETMKSLEERLDPAEFARVHRSAIVNLTKIKELKPLANGDYEIKLRSGKTITMSRTYRDEVLRRLR